MMTRLVVCAHVPLARWEALAGEKPHPQQMNLPSAPAAVELQEMHIRGGGLAHLLDHRPARSAFHLLSPTPRHPVPWTLWESVQR